MNTTRNIKSVLKIALLALLAVCFIAPSQVSAKQWFWGLGTGIKLPNIEGEQGLNTALFGPIQATVDLSPDEIMDYMETVFGLGGYATDGTWMIGYGFGLIELVGEPAGTLPAGVGGGTFTSELTFKVTAAELTLGYTAYRSADKKFKFTPYTGARYIKHELSSAIIVTQGVTVDTLAAGVEHTWTDILIGASMGYALSPKFTWTVAGDAGFGGSEGSFLFKTGLSYKASKHFTFTPNFSYQAIDFVNGVPTDSDWYLYDANEFGAGLGILYHF